MIDTLEQLSASVSLTDRDRDGDREQKYHPQSPNDATTVHETPTINPTPCFISLSEPDKF